MFKKIFFLILIILVAGLSSIAVNRYLFPYLTATKFFSKYEFLKKSAENVTVINKTEQVSIKEDSSIDKIAGQLSPAIVNIVSYRNQETGFKAQTKSNKASIKNGTGIIATSDGIIMTYANAIFPDFRYKIITSDGKVYDGEIAGIDSWSNLAFIKINASNLSVAPFADSDNYKSGEKIIAVGNDMVDYQNRFATGILNGYDANFNISGKTLSMAEKLEGVYLADFNNDVISVGGPIIDYSGSVIGIIGSVQKDEKNVFFEIPSNKVKQVLDKAIKKELNTNPVLGIYYIPISKSYALANNSSENIGVKIFSPSGQAGLAIISGSPAAKAGLALNDIIVRIDDEEINSKNNLSDSLYKRKKGDKAELTVIRNGQEIKIKLQL